ncbi:MAG: hypothetical protein ACR2P5_01540 [Gammaproteobacteria bacterium]
MPELRELPELRDKECFTEIAEGGGFCGDEKLNGLGKLKTERIK